VGSKGDLARLVAAAASLEQARSLYLQGMDALPHNVWLNARANRNMADELTAWLKVIEYKITRLREESDEAGGHE
jgi:hypothetical protein